jgi:hypothetical protein
MKENPVDVIFFQTADAYKYSEMLAMTSRTVIEYCRRHNYSYESYTGVKRGPHGWQASYNRIYQLQEIMDRGFRGWAIHMDADAYIVDLDFDLGGYLSDKGQYSAILTPSMATDHHWDINDGVALINLGHPIGREIVAGWRAGFDRVTDETLVAATDWLHADSDQDIIQTMLRLREDIATTVYLQSTDLINSSFATFIRQHLRGYSPNFHHRMTSIAEEVDRVLGITHNGHSTVSPDIAWASITAIEILYEALLGRAADEEGTENARRHFADVGFATGLRDLMQTFLSSDEYHDAARRRNNPVSAPAKH